MNIKKYNAVFSLILAICPALALAQGNFDNVEIKAHQVSGGIYMLTGQGGNIGLSIGDDGAFVVDDQFAPLSGKVKAAIAKLTDKPIKFVVNTHWHGDHTGGNEPLAEAGAIIVAHKNVRQRLAEGRPAVGGQNATPGAAEGALPVVTFDDGVTFFWNGQTIDVMHTEPAHTDGDSFIAFREANVIHTGDGFINSGYPFIDVSSGGSVTGFINNVTALLRMMDDDTKIIPGHGPISSKAEVTRFLEVVTLAERRIGKMKQEGQSLQQVQSAKPMAEYDKEWGAGFMTPDRFIEGVYNSL